MTDPILIPDLLRQHAAAEPHRTALVVDGRGSLSYSEWEMRSNAIARGLADRSVAVGDRIALFFENSEWLEFAIAYFGVLKCGAIAVPLSSRFAGPQLTSILDFTAATGVIWHQNVPSGPGWHATVGELEQEQSTESFGVSVPPEEIAEVLYTSGTTGLPKGVACRHMHVVRPLMYQSQWPAGCTRGGRVYLHVNAISTAGGQLRLLEPLGPDGMTTLALPVFDPDRFCSLTVEYDAAVVQLVPAVASAILNSGAWRRYDLSGVRVVSLGCAPLPPSLVPSLATAFPNARLINRYELSEARYAGTSHAYDGQRAGSVGRPHGATQLKVTDEADDAAPPGVAGEIWLRWRGLPPQHYFRDAEATGRVFVDGWTRTGDVGYLDGDGYLYLTDRLKDIIIKGGMNISSLEVENAMNEYPGTAECAVFGIPDKVHGEEIAAAVVPSASFSLDDLRRFLHTRLPSHKIPRQIERLAELPRNRSGKVLKSRLKARFPTQELLTQEGNPDDGSRETAGRLRAAGEPPDVR